MKIMYGIFAAITFMMGAYFAGSVKTDVGVICSVITMQVALCVYALAVIADNAKK